MQALQIVFKFIEVTYHRHFTSAAGYDAQWRMQLNFVMTGLGFGASFRV